MARTGEQSNLARIVQTQPSARGNSNAVGSKSYQMSEHCGACNHVGSATGGEDAMATSGDDIFEGALQIGSGIESPVESELERMSQLNKCTRAFDINRSVGGEHPHNDTSGPDAARIFNLLTDDGECSRVVVEAAGMRPHEDVNRYFAAAHGANAQRPRRSKTFHLERGTKLDAVGPAFLRGQACFKRFGTKFEYVWVGQEKYSAEDRLLKNTAHSGEKAIANFNR
jgi:hypothetical protein